MFTINTFSISKLNNAEFTGFMINLQKAITTADASKLGLTEVMTPFGTTLEKLIDQVYTSTGSEFTAAMLEADVKRDQTYKRIRLRLQMVEVAEDNPSIKAVKDVVKTHLLAKYTSKVPQLPYQEESAILQGFLFDLNDKLGSNGINALGISDDMAALEDANDSFIAAYNQRAAERAEGDTGLTVKLRQEMYALYQQVCFVTQYLANSTETANAEKATACQAFIAVLNVLLADAKKRYNQRISNGSGEEDSGSGSGSGEGHTEPTEPTDNGGSNGGSNSGSGNNDNGGSGSNTGNTDSGNSQGSGSDNGNSGSNTGNTDNSGSGNSQGSGSDSGSGSGDNTTDPNKPSEGGVVNGDEVSF